jgi:hypothetical protein
VHCIELGCAQPVDRSREDEGEAVTARTADLGGTRQAGASRQCVAVLTGGRRRVLAMVFDPVSIERVVRHLGLPHERPARAPPRMVLDALGFYE